MLTSIPSWPSTWTPDSQRTERWPQPQRRERRGNSADLHFLYDTVGIPAAKSLWSLTLIHVMQNMQENHKFLTSVWSEQKRKGQASQHEHLWQMVGRESGGGSGLGAASICYRCHIAVCLYVCMCNRGDPQLWFLGDPQLCHGLISE